MASFARSLDDALSRTDVCGFSFSNVAAAVVVAVVVRLLVRFRDQLEIFRNIWSQHKDIIQ